MGEEPSPALHVIVLGSGGGPQESNTTAFLVRAASHNWSKSSLVAVDAGVHLSAITRLLRDALTSSPPTSFPHTLTSGPFAGLSLPFTSPEANAAHITRALVDTYLFTHPHLDHIAGFVINTAGLPGTRPKKIAGLPSTIHAFKTHIFNNVIWPNLSDENNGAGLLTYLRLVEGGSPALGDGEAKGYLEVCDGLLVKTWSVSHGHCIERHSHRGSSASSASPRFGSHDASSQASRRDGHPLYAFNHHAQSYYPPSAPSSQPLTRSQTLLGQAAFGLGGASPQASPDVQERYCVYDSSAYFIQDADHRCEVLIFGDVEPDSISLNPRNLGIWQEAAPKVAAGTMAAIFIECSYDDSQSNDRLYGHLKPVFVIEELAVLAAETEMARRLQSLESRKRKRMASISDEPGGRPNPGRVTSSLSSTSTPAEEPVSPKSVKPAPVTPAVRAFEAASPDTPHLATPTDELSLREVEELDNGAGVPPRRPLEGLKVVIIHVKERLTDGPDVAETILRQLREHEQEARLGCEFIVSKPGQSFYF
ncbi:cyclic-AMP phosphodiesterase, class-II [Purpureocillium lilacinum]|uniref:Cyclic-AMP phosphodiesterase, class-II n=1 Tax=Purpureocillium lilacinum TaxID=33203 RepID=A0A179H5T0_PURLI|nr:cyclic-AMP phosphodiesterase, class-II [Purpureocillium lilacinum]